MSKFKKQHRSKDCWEELLVLFGQKAMQVPLQHRYFTSPLLVCMSSNASCTSLAPVTMNKVCQMPRRTLGNKPLKRPLGPCTYREAHQGNVTAAAALMRAQPC